ncbi:MAG: hypothetical protein ACTSU5_08220 [Promethearchaeota archaeon]
MNVLSEKAPNFSDVETEIYDKILHFYEKEREVDETEIWKGFEYVTLMDLYKRDPQRVQEIIKNSIVLILDLFSEENFCLPRGVDLDEVPPQELDEVLEDLQAIIQDIRDDISNGK